MAPARLIARRRGLAGGLFVVMSMGIAVVMVVLAIFVVVMMLIVVVIAMMLMVIAMIVHSMIMPRMELRIGFRDVAMAGADIGAAFGIERRLDLDHARPQSLHHRLDDVIAPDPQALSHDLGWQMAVAEMPGEANQMLRVGTPDLEQRLGGRNHLDQPAIVEHQRIAATQRDGVFQVEQKLQSPRPRHRHPPPVPIVEIEHHGIGRRLDPAMLPNDLGGADHAGLPR